MRIFILDSAYWELIRDSKLNSNPYRKGVKTGSADLLLQGVSGNPLAELLRQRGHSVDHVVANARGLQLGNFQTEKADLLGEIPWKYWQTISRVPVFGARLYESSRMSKTFMAQIREFRPDLLYVLNPNLLTERLCKSLAREGIKLVGQIASPLPPMRYFKTYALMVSALPSQVLQFKKFGLRSNHLPLAIDEKLVPTEVLRFADRPIDISFVGSFGRHHKKSLTLVKAVAEAFPQFKIYTFSSLATLRRLGLDSHLAGKVWGKGMFDIYSKSKVVLNRHIDMAQGFAVNFRMFEATAAGAVLLTEAAPNLGQLFEPNKEVLSYSNPQEAIEQISQALNSPARSEQIAIAGRARLKSEHVLSVRVGELEKMLLEVLNSESFAEPPVRVKGSKFVE